MTFTTPDGTRGKRQPGGAFIRTMNNWVSKRVRKTGGHMMGMNVVVLHTIGRKTGEARQTPAGAFPGPDGSWLVVAAAAGAIGNPAWYYNLAANPEISIDAEGQVVPVLATELHGAEREAAWAGITTAAPRFAQYQTMTDRELPIIELTPRKA